MPPVNRIELSDLTLAEFYDLESQLGEESIQQLENTALPSTRFGVLDPVTAVIILTKVAAPLLALWIAKNRNSATVTYVEESSQADGSTRVIRKTVTINTEGSDSKVLRQLSDAGLDTKSDD